MGKVEQCTECKEYVVMMIGVGLRCPKCGARWTPGEDGRLVLTDRGKTKKKDME